MALIDISEEEVEMIAEAIKLANEENNITDEYLAFNLLQRFKDEFPHLDYMFEFMDYGFTRTDEDEDED